MIDELLSLILVYCIVSLPIIFFIVMFKTNKKEKYPRVEIKYVERPQYNVKKKINKEDEDWKDCL